MPPHLIRSVEITEDFEQPQSDNRTNSSDRDWEARCHDAAVFRLEHGGHACGQEHEDEQPTADGPEPDHFRALGDHGPGLRGAWRGVTIEPSTCAPASSVEVVLFELIPLLLDFAVLPLDRLRVPAQLGPVEISAAADKPVDLHRHERRDEDGSDPRGWGERF